MSDIDPDDIAHLMAAAVGATIAARCLDRDAETATLGDTLEQLDDLRELLLVAHQLATQVRNALVEPFVQWDAEIRASRDTQQVLRDASARMRRDQS